MAGTHIRETQSNIKVNVGCGTTPTEGWLNFDNSFSIRAARWPLIVPVLAGPMALPLGTSLVFEAVEFDSAGDVGHAWLVIPAPGEIAGLFRLAGAGPAGAVADVEPRVEDLQQEGGQRQVKLVRGEKPP